MSKIRFDLWMGITYPTLHDGWTPKFFHKLWKNAMCKRGFHLFDEVIGADSDEPALLHYLSCDACDMIVPIDDVLLDTDRVRKYTKFLN